MLIAQRASLCSMGRPTVDGNGVGPSCNSTPTSSRPSIRRCSTTFSRFPYGDCKGLYVTNQTARSFEVRKLGGGTSNVPLHYRIMALRKNFENVRLENHTNDPDSTQNLPCFSPT